MFGRFKPAKTKARKIKFRSLNHAVTEIENIANENEIPIARSSLLGFASWILFKTSGEGLTKPTIVKHLKNFASDQNFRDRIER